MAKIEELIALIGGEERAQELLGAGVGSGAPRTVWPERYIPLLDELDSARERDPRIDHMGALLLMLMENASDAGVKDRDMLTVLKVYVAAFELGMEA